jgi:iron(III) transport system substrate-binding protein
MRVLPRLAATLGAAFLTLSLPSGVALAQVPPGYPADYQKVIDAARKEGKLVIYSTTDAKVAAPVVKDFEAVYPGVSVEFNDMNSTELFNRYISEQAAGATSGDVVWSSSIDSTLKLAQDYGLVYKAPESDKLPPWAIWKDTLYGMTYEPVAFVYNKRLITAAEVPTTRSALAKLISGQPDRFKNKVTTYDIEKSAVGFMFATQDMVNDPHYFDSLAGMSKAGLVVQSSTGTMMERISSGENLIGFDILGSYAESRAKNDPSIGVVYPSDFTLVLTRAVFISKRSRHQNAARLWVDYLISKRGQTVVAQKAELASIRDDLPGDVMNRNTIAVKVGKSLKPIPLNESLLTYLDQTKRLDFIKRWRTTTGK